MTYKISIDPNSSRVTGVFSDESPEIPANTIDLKDAEAQMILNATYLGDYVYSQGSLQIDANQVAARRLDEFKAVLSDAIQRHLDETVRARNYDGMISCASYAASTNPTFKAEAAAAIAWRDAVWTYCYAELAKVEAGTRAAPASTESFITELPVLTW